MTKASQASVLSRPRFFGVRVRPSGETLAAGSPRDASKLAPNVLRSLFGHLLVDSDNRPLAPSRVPPRAIAGALKPADTLFVVQLSVPDAKPNTAGWVLDPRTIQDTEAKYEAPSAVAHFAVQAVVNALRSTRFASGVKSDNGDMSFSSGLTSVTAGQLASRIVNSEVFEDRVPPADALQFVEDVGELAHIVLDATTGAPGFPHQTCEVVEMPVARFLKLTAPAS